MLARTLRLVVVIMIASLLIVPGIAVAAEGEPVPGMPTQRMMPGGLSIPASLTGTSSCMTVKVVRSRY